MKKLILIMSIGVLCSFESTAQNEIDALRYSQLTFGGTARFASMAGSMGALGGDISTLSFNPAGIAVFRKSELSITPSFFSQNTSSTFNGSNSGDRKFNLGLDNLGFVGSVHLKDDKNGGWQFFNFGVGYNQTNNFNNRINVQDYNKNSSLLDNYVASANGHTPADFDLFSTNLAYQAYLINPIGIPNQYNHVIPNYGEKQLKTIDMSGYQGETDISFGGNYKNKLFLGGTIGIVRLKYSESSAYTESSDTTQGFRSFTLNNNLTTNGKGFNFKFGIIFKPLDWLNIGGAIHSPTEIRLSDKYSSSITSDVDTSGVALSGSMSSPDGSFNYSVTTPWRAIGSIGFVIKKIAVINAEYEYVNYSYAQLHSTPNVFSDVNTTIRNNYTAAGNARVGGEVRLDPFAIRIGYAYYGSPYKSGDNANANRMSYTIGGGYRFNKFFMDIAYIYSMYTEYNYLYNSSNLTSIKNNYSYSNFMLTFGVKF